MKKSEEERARRRARKQLDRERRRPGHSRWRHWLLAASAVGLLFFAYLLARQQP